MHLTVGDHLIRRLREWGIGRIFGYPGDGIHGVLAALSRQASAESSIDFVPAVHGELAAFMACGHAKFTGQPGVCLASSGAGAIQLLNGLYDARLDRQPVVAIVGQQARASLGKHSPQEIDLPGLFKDVAAPHVQMVTVVEELQHVVDRAMRIATDQGCVTCIILPQDLQLLPAAGSAIKPGMPRSGIGVTLKRVAPLAGELKQVADLLNQGQRVAVLAGAGALDAGAEVAEVAELLGAGVAKTLPGKAALPDDLPYVTGTLGMLGTQPSAEMMANCDTLLVVGSSFAHTEFMPVEGQARGVQIDIDGRRLGLLYPMEFNLMGDARETLRLLTPLLQYKANRRWRERIERSMARWSESLVVRADGPSQPVHPRRVFQELSLRLPANAILTCDSGSVAAWFSRYVSLRAGMRASLSGGLASMGSALPYAVAAKYAHPDQPVFALLGDGSMQMNGINALILASRAWRDWMGIAASRGGRSVDGRLVVMVLNNGDLSLDSWEQRLVGAAPPWPRSQEVPAFDYAEYARLLGLGGCRVMSADAIAPAWEEAMASDRPFVLEFVSDPNVSPLSMSPGSRPARAHR